MNPMREIRIEKVVVNIGVGEGGEELDKAKKILKLVTKAKPVETICKVKNPTWGIRPGLPIGAKVTLRKEKAKEFLKRAFAAIGNKLSAKQFDKEGNFSFGIKEYIDFPDVKYDPMLGIKGMDICVTLERPGYRIKKRKIQRKKVGKKHKVTKEDAIEFVKNSFGVEII
ncbi:MAG: 50S ribosomal protein L5 [Candidatus Iainarchaeum archaeon]|uniref:Large ribosomal subunit protein uL5 n=2 Tax=Candidatus Iainarchaeum sp. TaxID=3101447 RepID=A0A497JFL2_9ARCH|nr:MAG: 50S ribosomal protein L5 [Candidatus Diapherotrites archaeon]